MNTGSLLPETATIALAIGLVFSLVCYLTTNLSPGGMITPGWLALTIFEDWRRTAIVVLMTALAFAGTKITQRYVILYGKRLFATVVLIGVVLQGGLFLLIQSDFPLLFAHQTLGFVIPGLIAYQLIRQPPVATLVTTTAVGVANFGVILVGVLAGLVPSV